MRLVCQLFAGLVLTLFVAVAVEALLPREASQLQGHGVNFQSFQPELARRHHITKDAKGMPIPLTAERAAGSFDAAELAIEYLRTLCPGTQWAVKDLYSTRFNGVTHVYLIQTYAGREIANSHANVNIDANGRVINAGESCLAGLDDIRTFVPDRPLIRPLDALMSVAAHLGLEGWRTSADQVLQTKVGEDRFVMQTALFEDDVPVALRYLIADGSAKLPRLTWHLVVKLPNNWFDVHVCSRSGKVLSMLDWVQWDSYEGYAIPNLDPSLGSRTTVLNPANKISSPSGWLDQKLGQTQQYTTTVGNNVIAQLNPTGVSAFTYNYRPDGNLNRSFAFPIDFFTEPYNYKDAAVANLFYWNNVIHDIFYQYGFTEEAGNFQENNFGKGGKADDAVQANAQDGSGYNNANFATPPDGQRPRMRMYLWDWSVPMKDGDLDSGIIVHEYGHGISTRLTGGPANSNCLINGQPGGMGEGWGDFWATMFIQKKEYGPGDAFPMGSYAAGRGIRPFPYSADFKIDPQTFGYINHAGYNLSTNVHAKGSVWCTILIDVYWTMVTKHGFDSDWYAGSGGNNALFRNVVDGLKLQPCSPSFADARDAIILADVHNYKGRHVCDLWSAFARRGLGYSANAKVNPVIEAFDLPPECSSVPRQPLFSSQ